MVTNPYAKKRQRSATTTNDDQQTSKANDLESIKSASTADSRKMRRTDEPPIASPGDSFSQAFGSVVGRRNKTAQDYFEEEQEQEQIDNDENPPKEKEGASSSSSPSTSSNQQPPDDRLLLQPHVLHVSTRQRGNPILRHIRNVPYTHSKIIPDYIVGTNRCILFLSCKYHSLHPKYIHRRLSELKSDFDLRVLLCLVDIDDCSNTLLYLNRLCVVNGLTFVLSWTEEEAARYVETLKAFETKDATSIRRKEQSNYVDQVADALSVVRSVNKTDSGQLLSQFGTFRAMAVAGVDELGLCPGMGEKKVRRLYEAFHKPFSSTAAKASDVDV